jgi:hypothetical protein
MLGVDFVISALFETSGLRWEGDWAWPLASVIASNADATADKSALRMRRTLMPTAESQNAKG